MKGNGGDTGDAPYGWQYIVYVPANAPALRQSVIEADSHSLSEGFHIIDPFAGRQGVVYLKKGAA
jgi:hypothetical protein